MPSFTNTFGGTVVYPADVSYRAIALTANVTLTWPTELATNSNVVASIMDVTPSGAGFTIRMPDATQASVGQTALFFNVGASSFTVADNSGNTIQTIASGQAWQIYLTDNATVNGTWRPIQYGAGTSSASASALAGAGLKAITTTLNQSAPTTLLSADYTLTSVDRARVIVWNGGAGTFTMPSASTAGNDWFFDARNSGTGGLTIQPAGGELINGQANLVFNPGDSARIITDGINFYTIGYGQSATFSFDYVSISLTGQPSPYTLSGTNLNRIAYQFSGILTANMEIVVPNTIQQYWVRNSTTGSYTLTVKTSGGTGVVVVQNGAAIMYCDGTNVVEADTNNVSSPIAVSQGGTGATSAGAALVNLGGTSLGIGIFTATNGATARASIGAAASGVNADITSLTGLTTPISVLQGGTGQTSYTNGQLLIGNTTGNTLVKSTLTAGTGISIANGTGSITISGTGPDTFPGAGIAYSTGTAWGTSYTTSGSGTTIALTASPALTGTPTAPTATAGTNTTQIATTAFVVGTAFSAALPGQSGNADKFVTTDGTTASWSFVPLASGVSGTLPVANGGTGAVTLTGVVKGNGTSAFTAGAVSLTSEVSGILPAANGGTGLSASGASGNVLTSDGTAWVSQLPAAGGITYTTVKTSNYTAAANDGVQTDTSGGVFTVTLPATPAVGDQVFVVDSAGSWANNNLTVGRNGSTIEGSASDLICNISSVSVQFVYNGTTWDVFAQVGGAAAGIVSVAGGGTGVSTIAANAVVLGNGTSPVQTVAPGTSGNLLTSNGTTWTSAAAPSSAVQYPQNIQSGNYTLVLGDAGKHIYSANTGAQTITIPTNASVAFPIGTVITIANKGTTAIILGISGISVFENGGVSASTIARVLPGVSVQLLKTDTDSWSVTFGTIVSAALTSYLIVAGGASGGTGNATVNGNGGGGAGGLLSGTSNLAFGTTYTITVGAGGASPAGASNGNSGSNSSALGFTSNGGGGGANLAADGVSGGSGGGGGGASSSNALSLGGAATVGQGFAGGGGQSSNVDANLQVGGGGGGAASAGGTGLGGSGGAGGSGASNSITGSSVTYAGGGGGGKRTTSGGTAGAGGSGGGGNGGADANGSAGTANRGGGGGGAGVNGTLRTGGAGGSGIVILSIPTGLYTGTTTGSPTVTTSGSNTILTFNSSGSYTA